ncbi:MAG: branched-chain amino acid ABC transporter permease [candidate division WOR-3 bacterium]
MILQFLINGLITGSIYAILGLGFSLVYNTTHIFHIAYAGVYVAGAYGYYFFYRVLNFPIYISFFFGVIVSIILNLITEILVYKPAYKRRSSPAILLISSIGLYICIVNLIALLFGNEIKIIITGIQKTYSIGNIILTQIQIIQFFSFLLISFSYMIFLKKTKLGILIRSLSDNPELLSSTGVNIFKLRNIIFIISGAIAGIASCLVATDIGIDPWGGMSILLVGIVSLIVGGVDKFESPLLGGLLIGIIQSLVVWKTSARWQDSITFLILIIFLLFKPEGIIGTKRRFEEI